MNNKEKHGKDIQPLDLPLDTTRSPHTNPKPTVFVSHDSRDADLAEAFGNLLTDVSGGIIDPFCSSDKKAHVV